MAERKVQNKYIPADFDPKVLQYITKKSKREAKYHQNDSSSSKPKYEPSRIMLPFNVCCDQCGAYMYRGRKFNAGKEICTDNEYLGVKIVRFHFKCENCSSEIIFRTNPKSSGFEIVSGARENITSKGRFNPLEGVVEKNEEKQLDALTMLEKRAMESKKEMALVDELEDVMERSQARQRALNNDNNNNNNLTHSSSSNSVTHDNSNNLDDQDDDIDADFEQARIAFEEKKRQRQLIDYNESLMNTVATSSTNTSKKDSSMDNSWKRIKVISKQPIVGDNTNNNIQSISGIVKPKSTNGVQSSLVPYDDDDDDD
jgi:hypothetical protein